MKPIVLLFIFKNNVLTPMRGQNADLDGFFKNESVRKANSAAYNDYTKAFIENNDMSEIYKSSQYSYDHVTHAFNFVELQKVTDVDLDNMIINSSKFDPHKSYNFINKENNINIIELINSKYKCPLIGDSGFYVDNMNWKFLVRNILKHKNTMLIGPTGTGKTELILHIAKALNKECNIYDMGAMQDPLTDLLGTHRLENGNSIFDYSKFVEDVQKPGIILLDELSRAPQMAMNILFPCLDSRRELRIDIAGSNNIRKVKVHPECVFIATANIGAEYSGTQEIDAALLNRFLPLTLDYMPQNIEKLVVKVRTNIDESSANIITNYAVQIRESYKNNVISKSMSTREVLNVAELVADGFTIADAMNYIVLQKFQDEDEQITVKSILMSL